MSHIDFQGIKQTIQGLKCQYIGERANWPGVHVFAVYNGDTEVFCYYDNQGRRVEFCGSKGEWLLVDKSSAHQIVKPPRKVEVTRWLCFKHVPACIEEPITVHWCNREPTAMQIKNGKYFKVEKVTRTLEVPE